MGTRLYRVMQVGGDFIPLQKKNMVCYAGGGF